MRRVAEADGYETLVRVEEEGGSSGKIAMDAIKKNLAGFNVQGVRATGSKQGRWLQLAAAMEAGRCAVAERPWTGKFYDEGNEGPNCKNDDQADAAALAFNELQKRVGGSRHRRE